MSRKIHIAFLDIDGVLTENFDLLGENFFYGRQVPFKQSARENIKMLEYYARCKFVITSSWRVKLNKEELELAFFERGLDIKIYDTTPVLAAERGQEIDLWLQANEWDNYVVIDDSVKDIENWCENIIKVYPDKGFSDANFQHCLAYIG